MFSPNKETLSVNSCNEFVNPNPDQEPMFSNHNSQANSIEIHNRSISQSSDASTFHAIANYSGEVPKSFNFQVKALMLDQLLKGFVIFYLAYGMMSASAFFIRQVLASSVLSNRLWNVIGILNSLVMIFNVILIFTSRIILYRNPNFRERETSKDNYLYFLLIVFPGCLSWFSLAFFILRDTAYFEICSVLSDSILPLSRMIFLMASITFIHHLMNYKIKSCATTTFHFIYKSTGLFIFITCINITIFEFLSLEATNLQKFFIGSNNSDTNYCYLQNSNSTLVKLNQNMQSYFHIFSIITNMASAIFLSTVIGKLYNPNYSFQSNRKLATVASHQPASISNSKCFKMTLKYSVLVTITLIGFFLLSSFSLIISIIKDRSEEAVTEKLQIAANGFPVFLYPLRVGLIIYLLRLLYHNFDLNYTDQISTTPIYITWISLLGMILYLLAILLENVYRLAEDCSWGCKLVNGFGVILQIVCIIETISQAMMLDYLLRLEFKKVLTKQTFMRICYCAIPLIAFNIGNTCADYYASAGHLIFSSSNDIFHKLIWYIFVTISFPFILTFRAICPLYLILFLSNIIRKVNVDI